MMYRSLLFIPAHEEKYYASVSKISPDVVIYDIEDAVPTNAKMIAKTLIANKIKKTSKHKNYIRIRHDNTNTFYEDISDTIELPIEGYILPKVESNNDVDKVSKSISYLEKHMRTPGYSIKLICLIESPKGILNVAKIAENSDRLIGLGFGGEDYSTLINAERINEVLLYPRNSIIAAAKAFNLLVFDTVYLDYKDSDGFKKELIMNKSFGFDGKFLIHPNQVAITNEIFSYSKEYIDKLENIVNKFEITQKKDKKNVIIIDDVIYEEPHVKRFKKIIEFYKR